MKKILILNGSFCETPLIKKTKEMGYYVITTGNAPKLEGHAFADEYIPGDYSNKEQMLELVKENKIDGIIGCANDFGTISAAYVAEKMGWAGHDTLKNTLLLHHKDKFKKYCAEHNIPSVQSKVFTDKQELLNYVKTCDYPIIIKANDLTGGKGIRRADTYEEAIDAAEYSFSASRDKKILVEPFIIGTQHAIDVFIVKGKIVALTGCNCYSNVNPYLIQTETYPSDFLEEDKEGICKVVLEIVKDLKLVDGVFTVQYMRSQEKFYIIEVMRRLTGNLSFSLYEKATGFPWYEGYIKSSLGLDCSTLQSQVPTGRFCGHHGIFARENGIIVKYDIPKTVRNHIYEFIELMKPGEEIEDYKIQRIASFFYTYDTKEEMEKNAQSFYNDIVVEMKEKN